METIRVELTVEQASAILIECSMSLQGLAEELGRASHNATEPFAKESTRDAAIDNIIDLGEDIARLTDIVNVIKEAQTNVANNDRAEHLKGLVDKIKSTDPFNEKENKDVVDEEE